MDIKGLPRSKNVTDVTDFTVVQGKGPSQTFEPSKDYTSEPVDSWAIHQKHVDQIAMSSLRQGWDRDHDNSWWRARDIRDELTDPERTRVPQNDRVHPDSHGPATGEWHGLAEMPEGEKLPLPKLADSTKDPQASDDLIHALQRAESGGDPHAVGPYIPGQGNAQGASQIMPATAGDPGFGVDPVTDPHDPTQAWHFAKQYMGRMLERYDNNLDAALAAYNWGYGHVDTWLENGADPKALPLETRKYIARIKGFMADPSATLASVTPDDPDKVAAARQKASVLGVPAETVLASSTEADQALAFKNAMESMKTPGPSSSTNVLYKDPDFAAVAHDVVPQVKKTEFAAASQSWWEIIMNSPGATAAGFGKAVLDPVIAARDISSYINPMRYISMAEQALQTDITGHQSPDYYKEITGTVDNLLMRMDDWLTKESQPYEGSSLTKEALSSVPGSVGPLVISHLIGAKFGQPIGRLSYSVESFSSSWVQGMRDKESFGRNLADSTVAAAIAYGAWYLPMGALAKPAGKSFWDFTSKIAQTVGLSALAGTVTESVQTAYDMAMGHEEMSAKEFLDRMYVGGLSGAATGAVVHVATEPSRRREQRRVDRINADEAARHENYFTQLKKAAMATGLPDRDPVESAKMIVEMLSPRVPDTQQLHISTVEEALGPEKSQKLFTDLGYTPEAIADAKVMDSSLPISHEMWAKVVMPHADQEVIQEHIRSAHDALTPFEAKGIEWPEGELPDWTEAELKALEATEEPGHKVTYNESNQTFEAHDSQTGKLIGTLVDEFKPGDRAHTAGVSVAQDRRRQGVGKSLYDAFAERHGGNIRPDGNNITTQAWDYWLKYRPEELRSYLAEVAKDHPGRTFNYAPVDTLLAKIKAGEPVPVTKGMGDSEVPEVNQGIKLERDPTDGARFILTENGAEIGVVDTAPVEGSKTLQVIWLGDRAGGQTLSRTLGVVKVRSILRQLKDLHPDIESVKYRREGGARKGAAAKEGAADKLTMDLSKMRTPQVLHIAAEQIGGQAMFATAKEAGLTNKQYAEYLRKWADQHDAATQAAKEIELKRQLKEKGKEWEAERAVVREQVEKDVSKIRVYRLLDRFAGKDLASQNAKDLGAVKRVLKMNRDILEEEIRGKTHGKLEELPKVERQNIFTNKGEKGGVDPQVLADEFGYNSVGEMVGELWRAQGGKEVAIEETTDRRMMEKHGELNKATRAIKEALAALHVTEMGDALTFELNQLADRKMTKRQSRQVLEREAAHRADGLRIKDFTPNKFYSAARRTSEAAAKLLRQGKRTEAYQAKFAHVQNFFMAKLAHEFDKASEKQVKQLRKWKRTNSGSTKELPQDTRDFLDQALRSVNLSDIGDMTVAEFNHLYETTRNAVERGRAANKLFFDQRTKTVDKAAELAAVQAHNLSNRGDQLPGASWFDWIKDYGRQWYLSSLNMDSILKTMDRGKSQGDAYDVFKRAIDQQVPKLTNAKKLMGREWRRIFSVYTDREMGNFRQRHMEIPGVHRKLAPSELIQFLGQSGNKTGQEAFLAGKEFTKQELDAMRMNAPRRELEVVRELHKLQETYYDALAKDAKDRHIYMGRKIIGQPYESSIGRMEGGYWNLRYDQRTGVFTSTADTDAHVAAVKSGKFWHSQTEDGFRELRQGNKEGNKVSGEINDVFHHLNRVLHDIHLGKAVNDVHRIMTHDTFQKAMLSSGNIRTLDYMRQWLDHVITGEVHYNNWIDVTLRGLKSNFTAANLAYAGVIALMQPNGILNTMTEISPKYMKPALQTMGNPDNWHGDGNMFDVVNKLSQVMANRSQGVHEEMVRAQRVMNQPVLRRALGKINKGKYVDYAEHAAYYAMEKAQRVADYASWLAGYAEGRDTGLAHEQAIERADYIVQRTQGSREFHNKTPFERGAGVVTRKEQSEFVRTLVPMINFMASKFNINATKLATLPHMTRKEQFLTIAAVVVVNTMLDAALTTFEKREILGPSKDKSGKPISWAHDLGWNIVGNIGGGVPVMRELIDLGQGYATGGVMGTVAKDTGVAIATITQAVQKGAITRKQFLAIMPAVGDLLGVPKFFYSQGPRIYRHFRGRVSHARQNFFDELFGVES